MLEEEVMEVKFRLFDGSDIGPFQYSPTSTVAMLKERIFSDWPKDREYPDFWSGLIIGQVARKIMRRVLLGGKLQSIPFWDGYVLLAVESVRGLKKNCKLDKKLVPKTANDIKLISAGKILENNKTVGQCKVPFGELEKGTITMHVVVQPPLTKAKPEKKVDEPSKKSFCSCSIL